MTVNVIRQLVCEYTGNGLETDGPIPQDDEVRLNRPEMHRLSLNLVAMKTPTNVYGCRSGCQQVI